MGWRTKFVFVLMVYFAGFATAIYCLAPPERSVDQPQRTVGTGPAIRSEEFARSVNSGMHKCIGFSKEAALEAAKFIRERIEEAQSQPKG